MRGRVPTRRRSPSPSPAPATELQHGRAADVLALQRSAGNAATRVALARKPAGQKPQVKPTTQPAPQATFKVLIVDDGKSGLDAKTLEIAIGHVRDELKKLTSASTDALVKPGFSVEYRSTAPERGKDFARRNDLDVTTWIVFLMRKGDYKKAVDIGYEYLMLDHRDREKHEKNAKASMATEGGHNLQTYSLKKGHPSESVSFIGTDMPLKLQGDKTFGPESAGRLMAEVILHELGHAMGHVHYQDDDASKDHDDGGIMAATTPIGSSGPYAPTSFSKKSADRIRARLEMLAGTIAARAATK